MFTIDTGNTIAVSTSAERGSKSGAARFTNEKQLAGLAAHWPSARLVEIWNNLPGVRKIAKFTDRPTGVSQIYIAERPAVLGCVSQWASQAALLERR
jgi:hypothetical protein